MDLEISSFRVTKRVPLTISRGTNSFNDNLWIRLHHDGVEGWGEASSVSFSDPPQDIEGIQAALEALAPALGKLSPWEAQRFEALLDEAALPSAARAALDLARWDWWGKSLGKPLWKLWGLDLSRIGPTTVTVGIMSPEAAQHRVRQWQEQLPHDAKAWKIKLGSPAGLDADQAMFEALLQVLPPEAPVMVDANGGWDLEQAATMCSWLSSRRVRYVEQPLAIGDEAQLPALKARSPLPLFADESCMNSADIPRLAGAVDGINIKLLKCGGLTEALRMIHTARAHGLQIMCGCFSESSLLNTAAAQLSPLLDALDLDSHLNLVDDPFEGAQLREGCLLPTEAPGLGVHRKS